MAGTNTKSKKGKSASFFSDPRNVIIVAFVVGFAGIGSYQIYQSSAASDDKRANSIVWCRSFHIRHGITMQVGHNGECVKTVQHALNVIGSPSFTYWDRLTVDGSYGPRTQAAVRQFQTRHGAGVQDGRMTTNTWTTLFAACSGRFCVR